MQTTADKIYGIQNRSIHKAMSEAGYPYNNNKDMWLPLLQEMADKRKVTGLSNLTLGERSKLIKHFRDQGMDLFSPGIPKQLWFWKKGDKKAAAVTSDRPIAVGDDKQASLSKIHAILADMGLPWSYVDSIAKSRFKVDKTEWLTAEQFKKVMQMLIIYQRRKKKEVS